MDLKVLRLVKILLDIFVIVCYRYFVLEIVIKQFYE